MTGVAVSTLQALNSAGVLKFHIGGFLMADGSADIPTLASLVDPTTGNITVPAGYESGGLVTTDGLTFSRSLSSDLTNSWQTLAAVRSDVSADAVQVKVKFQEPFSAVGLALREGLTIAAAKVALTGTGLSVKRDTSGVQPKRRVILVAQDTKLQITVARVLPNCSYSAQGDEQTARTSELMLDATLDVLYDAEFGSDSATVAGGPGWAALLGSDVSSGS